MMSTQARRTWAPYLSREDMMEAVSEGVRRGIWDMITNATSMPCADFFEAVKEGVRDGLSDRKM